MSATLDDAAATTYASWFATLADATRVQVLHAVATEPGGIAVGALARKVGIAQPTCSHHVKLLAEAGFVGLEKVGTSTVVRVNAACCAGLPHAADAVMGTLDTLPCCPDDVPSDVVVRAVDAADLDELRGIDPAVVDADWLPGHRRVAVLDGEVVGWAALRGVSDDPELAGVAETHVVVAERHRGRRIGVALIDALVRGADAAGLWTLQALIPTDDRAALRLHRSAGFRTIGVRERLARTDDGWRDLVLIERRRT
ncbi:helix-turn-helix domain-containing GNAT family N-acetyltransferase [Euzebya sp.]|uniref:helix-turn-helix domain-containing GNAT family N-acetyltransferase n=1 Tax=Euzebya sp. TaxID=1971409 RepID=UPI00351174FE